MLRGTSDICLRVTVIYLICSVFLCCLASQYPTCLGKAFPFPECSSQHDWCVPGLKVRSSGQSLQYFETWIKKLRQNLFCSYINANKLAWLGQFCETDALCHRGALIHGLKFIFSILGYSQTLLGMVDDPCSPWTVPENCLGDGRLAWAESKPEISPSKT